MVSGRSFAKALSHAKDVEGPSNISNDQVTPPAEGGAPPSSTTEVNEHSPKTETPSSALISTSMSDYMILKEFKNLTKIIHLFNFLNRLSVKLGGSKDLFAKMMIISSEIEFFAHKFSIS